MVAQRVADWLRRVGNAAPPRAVATTLRSVLNGWLTRRRFGSGQLAAEGHCSSGCGGGDYVEHSVACPRARRCATERIGLTLRGAEALECLLTGVAPEAHRSDGPLRAAMHLYASYRVRGAAHGGGFGLITGSPAQAGVPGLSSIEAKLTAAIVGEVEMAFAAHFLMQVGEVVKERILWADSSVCKSIFRRPGPRCLTHLAASLLYLQEKTSSGELKVKKVFGHLESIGRYGGSSWAA